MSKSTLPRTRGRISNYCWAENPNGRGHCTLPAGHRPGMGGSGGHHDPYTKTRW